MTDDEPFKLEPFKHGPIPSSAHIDYDNHTACIPHTWRLVVTRFVVDAVQHAPSCPRAHARGDSMCTCAGERVRNMPPFVVEDVERSTQLGVICEAAGKWLRLNGVHLDSPIVLAEWDAASGDLRPSLDSSSTAQATDLFNLMPRLVV